MALNARQVAFLPLLLACQRPATPGTAAESADSSGYDFVISGGRIIDGSGNPWYHGDLGIRGDRIARITAPGMLKDARARERIDAGDRIVAPGFIDIDSQSGGEFTMGDGHVVSMVTQGVTTSIIGEGESIAPINDRRLAMMRNPGSPYQPMADSLAARLGNPRGFAKWLDLMEQRGAAVNIGAFLGAQTVRVYAKGEASGAPTAAELDTMRAVVRAAMTEGAFGVASALIYPPGNYATTEELIEEARAAAPFGGIYITHMRSEADELLEAMDEALRIGKSAGVPVEIYHFKASGRRNWAKMPQAIAKIDSARATGADVSADMYLYTAGWTGLSNCAPPWAAADGKLLDNLKDPAIMARIKQAMLHPEAHSEGLCLLAGPEGVQFSGFRKRENLRWEGKRLSDAARDLGKDWVDAWALLVLSDPTVSMVVHLMTESNLPIQLRQPWIMIDTDANGADPATIGATKLHPRSFGNYPRLFGRYVREQGILTWEEAVRKSTSAVANRLSIRDRGTLREGAFADVVIFDPRTIIDRATYENPTQLSVGVDEVWVNGTRTLARGKPTGATPGRIVHGPGWSGNVNTPQ